MRTRELQDITEGVVGSLEQGLYEEVKFTERYGVDIQLRLPLCGLATAALQGYLASECGIRTRRVIVDLPERSAMMQNRHIYLRHEDKITIDPTYSQHYGYAGVIASDVLVRPEVAGAFPDRKIAVFDDAERSEFIANLAVEARAAAESAFGAAERTAEELEQLYRAIWQPHHYRDFRATPSAMTENVIERMKTRDRLRTSQ